jgi:hypothetical protein
MLAVADGDVIAKKMAERDMMAAVELKLLAGQRFDDVS